MKNTNTKKIHPPKFARYYILTNADKRRIVQAADEGDIQRVRELLNGLGTIEEIEDRDEKFEQLCKSKKKIDE